MPTAMLPSHLDPAACVSLIGMAGSGKTTVGRHLAQLLGYRHVDTDELLEQAHGGSLQAVVDRLGRAAFLRAEEQLVASLTLQRAVISTGGSVIYGPKALLRLKALGPVVWLATSCQVVTARVALHPERGLAIRPGQSLAELEAERRPLYAAAADLRVEADDLSPEACAEAILQGLADLD